MNDYRPSIGTATHNEFGYPDCVAIPACGDGEYRPDNGTNNADGYVDCEVIPTCSSGWYRPETGTTDASGLIPCEELPACATGNYRPTPNAACTAIPDCVSGYYRPSTGTIDVATNLIPCEELPACDESNYRPTPDADCEAIPDCGSGWYRPETGTADGVTGLIPCAVCDSFDCPDYEDPACTLDDYYYDETYLTYAGSDYVADGYKPYACTNNCECDGNRYCEDIGTTGEWCKGTARTQEGIHYPYDPLDPGYLYDPSSDTSDPAREINDVHGYPSYIDPATGLDWGIDPDTDVLYTTLTTWPADDPADPDTRLDPMMEEATDFGLNPETPTVEYGIDPSTGRAWHNNYIDSAGMV